jgi:hypothetical protein
LYEPASAARFAAATAYDEHLAGCIRQLIGSDPALTGKKMFDGLAFLNQKKPPRTCSRYS